MPLMKITGEKKLPENEYALITIDVQEIYGKVKVISPLPMKESAWI